MRKPCKVDGCDSPSAGRGWCQKHWTRWRKHGDPTVVKGFPPGWLDGLTPAQQLKAAGNAVCQQQAELALRILLGDS